MLKKKKKNKKNEFRYKNGRKYNKDGIEVDSKNRDFEDGLSENFKAVAKVVILLPAKKKIEKNITHVEILRDGKVIAEHYMEKEGDSETVYVYESDEANCFRIENHYEGTINVE